jgi:tetratricopeptide (TPR) repeat protein
MLAKKAFYGLLWVMAEVAIAHPGIHEQIDVLNERLKKQPTYQLYAQRAHLYFEGGQTDLALKDLDLASKLGPKEPLLFEYGNANAAQGDYKRALQYFDQFIQFNNTFPEAYQARAHTLKQLGRDEDAIRDLKHSFGMRQAAPPGLYIEAANVIVSGKNKDFQAAIDLLDEGI